MSRLLLAAPPSPGHVNPMLALAQKLTGEGYEIGLYTGELFRKQVESAGLQFLPFPSEADFDHRDPLNAEPSLKETPSKELGLKLFAHLLGGRIPFLDASLRKIVEKEKIDAILHDVLFMGALPMLLRSERRPAVIGCGVIPPMWFDAGSSLTNGFSKDPGWRERNIADNQKVAERRSSAWRYLDGVLQTMGLAIPGGFHDNQLYRLPDVFLQFEVEAFEFPREEWQGTVAFVGPLLPQSKGADPIEAWLKARDRTKPLVFVSQGTVANRNLEQLVRPTIDGLADEDVQVLAIANGPAADKLAPSSNTHPVPFAAYEDVLPEVAVFVTNGGFNGVQQALSCGVPVITAGTTEDKPRVGHRVEWTGVGINLGTATPSKEQVRDAVFEILKNSSYRERAHEFQMIISQTDTIQMVKKYVNAAIKDVQQKA